MIKLLEVKDVYFRKWGQLSAIAVLFYINRIYGVFTISLQRIDDLILALFLLMPLAMFLLASKIVQKPLRVICQAISVFVGILSSIRLIFLVIGMLLIPYKGSWLGNKGDASFELIKEFEVPHSNVAVYRTNGGATTAFGIVVRQERSLGFVHLSKVLYSEDRCDDADISASNPGEVSITACSVTKAFRLKPWVYF